MTDVALAYATLILSDSKLEVSQQNISKLIKKAGVKVDDTVVASVAHALKGKDVSQWFSGCGGGSAPAASN